MDGLASFGLAGSLLMQSLGMSHPAFFSFPFFFFSFSLFTPLYGAYSGKASAFGFVAFCSFDSFESQLTKRVGPEVILNE